MADFPPIRGLTFGGKVAVKTAIINAPTLATLSLTANQFTEGDMQGTLIGNLQGSTGGSTLLLINSNSGAALLASGIIRVGPTPPTNIGPFNINFNIQLMEVLDGATNSPNISTIGITELTVLPTINTPPSIPGTPMAGLPIMAIDAIWNNAVSSVVYQWQANGVNATGAGATTLTYTPVSGDVGLTLTIIVTAMNAAGSSMPSTSAPSATVIGAGTFNSTPYVILLAA